MKKNNSVHDSLSERMLRFSKGTSGFDYLRLCLAMAIVIFHSISASYGIENLPEVWGTYRFAISWLLPMFFALSGFLVSGSLLRSQSLVDFVGHRIIRIFPALSAEVFISALFLGPLVTTLPLVDYFTHRHFWVYWRNIVGDIHYILPGVFPNNPYPRIINGPLWSVPFELASYVSLIVVSLAGLIKRPILGLVALILGIAVYTIYWSVVESDIQTTPPLGSLLVFSFLTGVVFFLFREKIFLKKNYLFASIILGTFLLSKANLSFLATPFLTYVTVYLGLLNPSKNNFLLKGDYSYGLYLFSYPLQQLYSWLFPGARVWWLNSLFAIVTGLLCAYFSWNLIEKPLLQRRNRIIESFKKIKIVF